MIESSDVEKISLIKQDEIKYWNTEFEKCKSLREPYERQWYLNLAFYAGRQYVTWTPAASPNLSAQNLREPPAPRHRVRIVANKIKPAVRTELTKLTKEEPQFYAVPNTPEPSDVAASKVSETIVEFLLEECEFNRVRRKATWWMLICGLAYEKTYIIPKPQQPEPMQLVDPATGIPVPPEYKFFNNIQLDYATAFHIYVPNPQEEELEKQPYVIHARSYSSDEVYSMYGVRVRPQQGTSTAHGEQKFLNAIGIKSSQTKDLCFVREIWIKPCQKYPAGGLLVFAENQLVYSYKDETKVIDPEAPVRNEIAEKYTESTYPFKHGRYPYDKIEHIPSGSYYSTSTIEDLISLQREYNKTRSQIVESKNRLGKPQMTYAKGSIDPRKVTSEPGLMIPVNPGFDAPKPLITPPIPGYVIQELDRTLRDMDDLTGQYEVSKGRTPPGVEAASAIAYLQEENDSKLHHTVASIEEATRSIGRKMLSLVQEFWTKEDILHIVSKNATFEASMFKMADMENNADIRVEPGSMAPKSRAAKQAFITDLMKMGIIPPEKGLRYLEMNETNRLYEELQADAKQAQRENYRMAKGETQGQPLPVNVWDNTPVHLHEHGLFLKSQEFELLEPELKMAHIQHYGMHKMAELGDMTNGPGIPGTDDPGSDPAAGTDQQQFPGF